MIRIGHGYDVHKFGGEGPITLAGVKIPYIQGLIAHSDGDVVIHAFCDAILGALALGDIGRHFPDNDDAYKNIDSRKLLFDVYKLATEKGYRLGNADITIIAQAPKMAPFINDMCTELARVLDIKEGDINVKATTTEELGPMGRKEGISTHAVVILLKDTK
ncbi:2-C-methyl-D-erythritol 2,4-cyclodiphosphate synthase [Psychromonas algicola]|uniref:2-C-methyl-D-erythritol 2,4-cyclodiphosphate synthase n=1 Tax=Psychromonas algicola TaxID=2555642 RepID=UPI00106770F5|nr:2-C-methyl-D-erythritol 2,4-cyclodiphosphate synthase [Psychromonas sp. RZ5]TEW50642.1 2-C-methyl-D-erythritol 2,4-cyclodiphosphate synthase [Psychromonas sp. RZ5]